MSARLLTDGHLARAVRNARDPEPTDPEKLGKDQMRLYSYYRPSLQANEYVIEATQTVTSVAFQGGDQVLQSLQLSNTSASDASKGQAGQVFEVVVPRFSIDPAIINSYYPPDGHQDEARILPHIVFNDPHYPWEIAAGTTDNLHSEIDGDRSIVPWVALLVFDTEDLHLPTVDEATSLGLPGFKTAEDLKKQNPDGTFPMQVKNYFDDEKGISASARVNYAGGLGQNSTIFKEILSSTENMNVIFPEKELIKTLFSAVSTPALNTQPSPATDGPISRKGLEQLKYLAHVRNINTEGCPDAGVEQEGLFSVVVAARTGALRDNILKDNAWTELPTNLSQPRTQIVHLVSIEHLDQTYDLWGEQPPVDEPAPANHVDRIGLVSLHSWIYQGLPPNPVNFITTMRNLTENQQMLRVDDKLVAQLESTSTVSTGKSNVKVDMPAALLNRLKMGYTLARWRTQTGEETTAFNRGPLIPMMVPTPDKSSTITDCSFTSQDYQILDPQTGLIDVSYSSAWQLGKLLAISDTTFSAALMRFRSTIRNSAADQTRMKLNNMTAKSELVTSMTKVVSGLRQRTDGNVGDPHRARGPTVRDLVADVTHPNVLPVFQSHVKKATALSSSTVPTSQGGAREVYTGFNVEGPSNSDWPVIHNWLSEKLALGGIPPQYLIPEPSFCPQEALRFFAVDDRWLDCLLDGALSVANHLDQADDIIRRAIKKSYNDFLDNTISEAGIKPQIPCSGFVIRSQLIKAMPDLRITVQWQNPDNRYPVCRWTQWDDQTLMCLLDRRLEEIDTIILAQPQHQQRYALGGAIDATPGKESITFVLRTIINQPPGIFSTGGLQLAADETVKWLDFPSRRLNTQIIANNLKDELLKRDSRYTDTTPDSSVVGIELNDPAYFFQIKPPPGTDTTQRDRSGQIITGYDPNTFKNRQLYVRDVAADEPKPPKPPNGPTPPNIPTAPPTSIGTPLPPLSSPSTETRVQPLSITSSASGDSPSGLQRKFTLTVFADYKGFPTRLKQTLFFNNDDFIPTRNVYYFDLIFSVQRPPEQSDLNLLKITVDIPMKTKDSPTDKEYEPLLTDEYDGAGVRMLANQRFIPFLYTSTIQGWVPRKTDRKVPVKHIELIPRSTNLDYAIPMRGTDPPGTGSTVDLKTTDISFRLIEAGIVPTVTPTLVQIVGGTPGGDHVGVSTILWTEYYATSKRPKDGECPASGQYLVMKKDTPDPNEPK